MMENPIITTSGLITKNIHHVDLNQYGMKKLCSAFILETRDNFVIIDCGTSDDVQAIIKYMRKNDLSLKKVSYLVPSHYHFDHFGGGWKLYRKIKKYNPAVKILTTGETKKELQDPALHLKRAQRTFGPFVGEMHPIADDAFEIIDTDIPIKIPGIRENQEFILIGSPGHTRGHVAPAFIENGDTKFIFGAEAIGTLFHSKKLVTFGTSMPPDFNFKDYIKSLEKIIEFKPETIGYCHFGVVKGKQSTAKILQENKDFSFFFRDFVKDIFEKTGRVRFVVEKFIEEEVPKRTDWNRAELLEKILVALVYGQLVDLGLKEPKPV
ncbi:MAG: MBL fold metallo-hydrolase [Promethearchaeota archaeon]